MRTIIGLFIVLHGLVHLFYAGHSLGLFDLQSELTWPDGSWAFSKLLGDKRAGSLASIAYVLAAIAFVVGGAGILFNLAWWPAVVVGSAIYSGVLIILFWDGNRQKLADQGGVGLLIDIAILAAIIYLKGSSS